VTDVWVHPTVRAFGDQLAADAGHPVTYEKIAAAEWRIIIENDRVRMTVDYRRTGKSKILHAGSTLAIDGQRVKLASSYEDFIRIFNDPAAYGTPMPTAEVDPTNPDDIGNEVPADQMPAKLRQLVDTATTKMPDNVTVRIGRAGRRWTIAMTNDQVTLRMNLTGGQLDTGRPHRRVPINMASDRPIELWVNGTDLTDQVAGRLDIALGLINGTPHAAAPAPAPIRAERSVPGTATGVAVRNVTVIRN
jgi:hypothetical protein